MRTLVLAVLAAGLASALAAAPAPPLRYQNADLHYALTLPQGWVSIPPDVLKTRGNENGLQPRGVPAPVAGFQAPADSWFRVPAVVLSHIPDKGRRPKEIDEEMSHDKDIGANGKAMVFDPQLGMVEVFERMPSNDGGQIQRVAVFKPGTEGILHLDFYFPLSSGPAYYNPTVEEVLKSVQFEPGFATQDLPPGEMPPAGELLREMVRKQPMLVPMVAVLIVVLGFNIVQKLRRRM